ncbi:MAG TPA: Calx-beta domain-containing protein, partial [Candidatus Limnocylindrales bacterium]
MLVKRLISFSSILAMVSGSVVALASTPAYAATTYFVDATAGNDSTGTGSSSSPWKTISKAASVAIAGDTVKIRSGTYRETVRPANSGTAGAPITYEPDAGANVTVSGANPVTTPWTVHSGNIYKNSLSLPMGSLYREQIYVDGVGQNLARSPNSAVGNLYDPAVWHYNNAASTSTTLNDPVNLNQPDNTWAGAVVIAEDPGAWNFSGSLIQSSTPGNVTRKTDQKSYSLRFSSYDNNLQLISPSGAVLGTHNMSVSLNTTYNLKVTATGGSLQVFVNNGASPVITATNSELLEGTFGLAVESNNGLVGSKAEFSNVNAAVTSADPNQAIGRFAPNFSGNIRGWSMPQDAGWWETVGTTLVGATQPQLDSGMARYESSTTAKDFTYSANVKLTSAANAYMSFRKERGQGWTIGFENWGLGNSEYWIQGKLALLDFPGEWFHDKAAGQVYLQTTASDNPANHTVEYKARDYAFDLYAKSHTVIKGLKLFAATIDTSSGSNNVIDGINAKYVSDYNVSQNSQTGICVCGTNDTLRNSEVAFSSSTVVTVKGENNKLVNNLVHDAGYSGTVFNAAVDVFGRGHLVSHNTIHTGGNILLGGDFYASVIQYNHIHHGTALAEDGGLFYTAHNNLGYSEIHHNWFHDPLYRSNGDGLFTGGIYLDVSSSNALIYKNVTTSMQWLGVLINAVSNFVHVYNNTTYSLSKIRVSDNSGDGYGDRIVNNIATEEMTTGSAGATASNNLTSGDPLYVNAAANDLRLQSGSPARNAGVSLRGITDGHEGANPDIGAYEFGSAQFATGHNFANPPVVAYQTVDVDFKDLLVNGTLDLNRIQHPTMNSLSGWTRTHSQTAQPAYDHAGQGESSRIAWKTGVSLGTGQDGIEQTITGLQPNTTYKIRGFLKAHSAGQSVRLGVKNHGAAEAFQEVTSTSWTETTLDFTTGASSTSATIYGFKPTTGGYAWVDDVSVAATVAIARPGLRVDDVTLTEGHSGTKQATFTVSLSSAAAGTVTVNYATANNTAVAPGDYTAASGQLTFTAGQTSKPVTVNIAGDTAIEADESFSLNLSSPTGGAVIADGLGVGTIVNDDATLGVTSVNDHTTGTGNNQFEFAGSWATNSNATAYQGDVTFADQTDAYYQVRFVGTQIKLITEKHNVMGIVG